MESELKIISDNNNTIIISFGGAINKFGGIQPFEFLNFLNINFKNCDKYFYIDKKTNRYHYGIDGITNNIDETVEYLKNIIFPYKNVYFIGVSAGGYAAILFGSLLNITKIMAFIPPTLCNIINDKRIFNQKYSDLLPLINNTTLYFLYGDLSVKNINDSHHISHCQRLSIFPNVFIKEYDFLNIVELRNNGELLKIFNSFFYD
jgi:hypothetical protein